jgi:type IV pilus assembly protein PilA
MLRFRRTRSSARQAGFSLVELTIVVVILGVLAMVGIPKYYQVTERSKASEAFNYLQHVGKAQAMYEARHGIYAKDLGKLGLGVPPLKFFEVGELSSLDWQSSWQLRLRRSGAAQGFGDYTVSWNQDGFSPERSSIAEEVSPVGIGGKLVASGSSRGNTRPRTPQPTGSLEWDRGEPQSFGEYRDRMFEANSLDYKRGDDPYLDIMLWYLNITENWFNGGSETQDQTNQRFFDMQSEDYSQGDNRWMDFILGWHYSYTSSRLGW